MRLNAKNKKLFEFFGAISRSKPWLVMKITVLLLFAAITMAAAKSYSQKINLELKKARMETVFSQIEKQSGYSFIYEKGLLRNLGLIDVSLQNNTITEALSLVLKDRPLEFIIRNMFVVISPKEKQVALKMSIDAVERLMKITGTVRDTAGVSIPGVSILNKRNGKVVSTNSEGAFALEANAGDVLVFSFIGFVKQEITVAGETKLSIVLKEEKNVLEQVVVTALGIKKSTKALTYNVQEIKSEELTRVPDASFVNSLSGKVAGVTINSSASGIGGSTRVVMRGDKSINGLGNNNVLYVLDGIPLPNLFSGASSSSNGRYGGVDDGDGISNINPEDIASLSVLTGPSAAALYGGEAANGVIMITTKSGSTDGKAKISISSNASFFSPFVLPGFQDAYGSRDGEFSSWGTKLAEPSSYRPNDFFQTGYNVLNSVGIALGNEKNRTYVSLASTNAEGIVPNNTFNRYNLTFNGAYTIDPKLTLGVTLLYINKNSQNMVAQGDYFNPIVPVYLFPRGDEIDKYKLYERYNPNRNFATQFWPYGDQGRTMQNPYWTVNRDFNTNRTDRYLIGGNLKYNVLDWLNITGRVRLDRTQRINEIKNYASTLPFLASGSFNGSYLYSTERTNQSYADVIANANKKIAGDFGLTVNVGASINNIGNNLTKNSVSDFGSPLSVVPNMFSLNNVASGPQYQNGYTINTQAIFANASLDYKNKVFLDFTGRAEWTSLLANLDKPNGKPFFYPSVGLSGIISDIFHLPGAISYLKIRGSYASVGNTPSTLYSLTVPSYPVGPSGVTINPDLPLTDLQFERTKSFELGLNSRFLDNKISLDVSLYNSNTYNQLFKFIAPISSGYNNYYINAGKVNNKGIEALLSYNGGIGKLRYAPAVTFTLNRNKIVSLVEDKINPFTGKLFPSEPQKMGGIGSFESYLTTGGSVGDMYVNSLKKDGEGYIYLDPNSLTFQVDNQNLIKAGNSNPKFTIGFRNEFTYQNFSLSFLIDGRFGGENISATQAVLDAYGASEVSAKARDNGGVLVNGIKMDAESYYKQVGGGTGVLAYYVYRSTNVRLREAALSYTSKSKILWNKIQGYTLAITGNNLFMFYNKAPFDPQSTSSTGTYFQGIDYFMLPSLKSLGFSVKFNL